MKPITIFFSLVLLAALIAPFFLTINGKRLMTFDKVVDDTMSSIPELPSEPTPIYKWQDADGVWQFGQEPPANAPSEQIELDDNITPVSSTYFKGAAPQRTPAAAPGTMPVPGVGALLQGKELMEQTQAQVGKLNERQANMDAAIRDLNRQ